MVGTVRFFPPSLSDHSNSNRYPREMRVKEKKRRPLGPFFAR